MAERRYGVLEHVLVRYRADQALLHERVILAHHGDREYTVVTPDRDVYKMSIPDAELSEVRDYNGARLPGGVRRRDCHLAVTTDHGPFSEDELRALVALHGVPVPRPARRLTRKSAVERGEESVWLVIRAAGGFAVGDVLQPGEEAQRTGDIVVAPVEGGTVVAERVATAVLETWKKERGEEYKKAMGAEKVTEEEDCDLRVLPARFDSGGIAPSVVP